MAGTGELPMGIRPSWRTGSNAPRRYQTFAWGIGGLQQSYAESLGLGRAALPCHCRRTVAAVSGSLARTCALDFAMVAPFLVCPPFMPHARERTRHLRLSAQHRSGQCSLPDPCVTGRRASIC